MDFTICFQIQLNLMIGECELMWSKTRKSLNNRLADSLKKQVSYSFESYVINRHELPVFKIVVNKKHGSCQIYFYLTFHVALRISL